MDSESMIRNENSGHGGQDITPGMVLPNYVLKRSKSIVQALCNTKPWKSQVRNLPFQCFGTSLMIRSTPQGVCDRLDVNTVLNESLYVPLVDTFTC